MPEFLNEVKKIITIYSNTTGIEADDSAGLLNKYRDFVLSIAKQRNAATLESFSKLFSGFVKFFPFISGIVVTIFYQKKMMDMGITLAIVFAVTYVVMLILESKIPKDASAWINTSRSLEMERALHILAAQINFYSKLDKITHDDDETRINLLSAVLDDQLTSAINTNSQIKTLVKSNNYNQNLDDTQVEVKDIPPRLHEKFNSVAESVHDACYLLFGSAKYSVKIYLRTKHNVEGRAIQTLTSLVKYPRNSSNTSGGRSFLLCKGKVATVWDCFNGQTDLICKKNEPKNTHPETYYPSIVYIKLPQGIGVLTIVSSKETTFAENSNITDDVRQTLMVATNTLCRVALENFQTSKQ